MLNFIAATAVKYARKVCIVVISWAAVAATDCRQYSTMTFGIIYDEVA